MWLFRLRRMFRVAGRDALILFLAIRDPRTPRHQKVAATAALAWIVSPLDPLPDLPLIGWVDDMLILTVALPLLMRRLPAPVREQAIAGADRFIAIWWPGKHGGQADRTVEMEVLDARSKPVPRRKARPRAATSAMPAASPKGVVPKRRSAGKSRRPDYFRRSRAAAGAHRRVRN